MPDKDQILKRYPELAEFDEFLKENYSENVNTRRTIIYAVHRLLEAGVTPDDLSLSTRSKSTYRRAWRLWQEFLAYKNVNPSPLIGKVRRAGVIREGNLKRSLKSVLKNEVEYRMAMLKAINSGKVYVSYLDNEPKVIYVD